ENHVAEQMHTAAVQKCSSDELIDLPVAVWRKSVLVPETVSCSLFEFRNLSIELFAKSLRVESRKPFLILRSELRRFLQLLLDRLGFAFAHHADFGEFLSYAIIRQQLGVLLNVLLHASANLQQFTLLSSDNRKGHIKDNYVDCHYGKRNPGQSSHGRIL